MKDLLKLTDINTIARASSCKVVSKSKTNNGIVGTVKSENNTYTSSIFFDGSFSCSCPDFSFRRRFCKHLVALYKTLSEDEKRTFLEKKMNSFRIKIPTSVMSLNKLTDGGIPVGVVLTITGEPKVGKTFLAYQLACEVSNILRKPALYIDTEGLFTEDVENTFRKFFSRFANSEVIVTQMHELEDLANFLGLNLKFDYKFDKVEVAVSETKCAVLDLLNEIGARMLVIDSLSQLVKTKIPASRMQDFSARSTVLNALYGKLDWLAATATIPLIVVQHVSRNPRTREYKIYGGPTMMYFVKYCLFVDKIDDSRRRIERLIWPGKKTEYVVVEFRDGYGYVG